MQKIIILNGPAGVGKTTVSKLLVDKSNSSVCIHGDDLREMIVSQNAYEQGRLGYKNGASLINNFRAAGYELIIFEYVFPSQQQIDFLIEHLHRKENVSVFTLWADKDTVLYRENGRERESLGKRVEECYDELRISLGSFDQIVQTAEQTADDVADTIWQAVADQAN